MRTLLMLHPDFLPVDRTRRAEALDWLRVFARETGSDLFSPQRHRVNDYGVIHVFSGRDAETWYQLKKAGRMVVVTPEWIDGPRCEPPRSIGERVLRSIKQGRWPPVDEEYFFRSADAFLWLSREQRIGAHGEVMPADAQGAARTALQHYKRLST